MITELKPCPFCGSRICNYVGAMIGSRLLKPQKTTNERKTNMLTPVSMLEIDDVYVQFAWKSSEEGIQTIAIFRDETPDDGLAKFSLSQVRGPWSTVNKEGIVVNKEDDPDFIKASTKSVIMLQDLNTKGLHSVKQSWDESGGKVYDY